LINFPFFISGNEIVLLGMTEGRRVGG